MKRPDTVEYIKKRRSCLRESKLDTIRKLIKEADISDISDDGTKTLILLHTLLQIRAVLDD